MDVDAWTDVNTDAGRMNADRGSRNVDARGRHVDHGTSDVDYGTSIVARYHHVTMHAMMADNMTVMSRLGCRPARDL
jgi:hypothetical protein